MTNPSSGCLSARTDGGSAPWTERSGRLWDAATGRSVAMFGGPKSHVTALFEPDGRQLVIGSEHQLSTVDATTGRRIAVLGSHENQILQLAVSPDGKRIASHGLREKTIRLWDGITGREVAVLARRRGIHGGPELQSRRFAPRIGKCASG